MRTQPILYYIYGNQDRGTEVIQKLKDQGGINKENLKGNMDGAVYYIKPDWNITYIHKENKVAIDIIQQFGQELLLGVIDWSGVSPDGSPINYGYALTRYGWSAVCCGKDCDGNIYANSQLFATSEQIESVRAAAMISQIRKLGKKTYGEIIPKGKNAWVIVTEYNTEQFGNGPRVAYDDEMFYTIGGLLRFDTEEQAELFLKHNEDIVINYLRTF